MSHRWISNRVEQALRQSTPGFGPRMGLSCVLLGLAATSAGSAAFAATARTDAPPSFAQAPAPEGLEALLTQAARQWVPQARVEVTAGQLDSRLRLAPCTKVQPYLPSGASAWGRTRVGLRCVDGAVRWNVFLPVQVKVWAPALVAAQTVPAGADASDAGLWQLAEVDWAAAPTAPLTSVAALAQRRLARPVAAGQALRIADLQTRQWFASGEQVTIVAQGAGFQVHGEGQALGAGLEGQTVRVKTESGRVLVARPVAPRRVEVVL